MATKSKLPINEIGMQNLNFLIALGLLSKHLFTGTMFIM